MNLALVRTASLFLLTCTTLTTAIAADAIIKRRATLRSDPSTQHPPILTLMPQEDVELIENTPKSGYFHVRTSEGEEGWVYSHSIELVQTVAAATPIAPIAMPSAGQPSLDGGVLSSISPDWDKPEPNETTFNGPDGTCGPTGDGGDTITNRRKNRTDVPGQYHEVTWSAVQALPYPVADRSLLNWTPDQLAQIKPFEGIPVSVVGYVAKIKIEDRGSGESTNCHFTNTDEVDWHIPLVQQPGDSESTAIVVETTPRVRQLHPNWAATALAPWTNSPSPVRISGWTLLDPEHRAHLGKYRSTLWEIHPITKIEVFKDGQWADLDALH